MTDEPRAESGKSSIVKFGTVELPAALQAFRIGRLGFALESGLLRRITLDGAEMLRAIGFVVRGPEWQTPAPRIADQQIRQSETAIGISLTAHYDGLGGSLAVRLTIHATAEGRLRIEAEAQPSGDFVTARAGFCVLHPMDELAGTPMRVRHVDGRVLETAFPDPIAAHPPVTGIRAIQHRIAGGGWATIQLDGDIWEMEDQRNWGDASTKTYGLSTGRVSPFTLKDGDSLRQSATLTVDAPVRAVAPAQPETVTVRIGAASDGRMPELSLALSPDHAGAGADIAQRLGFAPQSLVCWVEAGAAPLARLRAYAGAAAGLDVPVDIELVLPCKGPVAAEALAAARQLREAGLVPRSVLPIQAKLVKLADGDARSLGLPSFADLQAACRAAFPNAAIGAGVTGTFNEFNQYRPETAGADFVSHGLMAAVHDASDRAVIETLQSVPATIRSMRALLNGQPLPYRLGPSQIGMRYDLYGPADANRDNRRLTFAAQDPRHRGLLGMVHALGLVALAAEHRLAGLCYGALAGPFGLMHERASYAQPWFDEVPHRAAFPVYHVVQAAAAGAGRPSLDIASSDRKRVLGFGWRRADGSDEIWLGNLTDAPVAVALQAASLAGLRSCLLESGTFRHATGDPAAFIASFGQPVENAALVLPPYAAARLRGTVV